MRPLFAIIVVGAWRLALAQAPAAIPGSAPELATIASNPNYPKTIEARLPARVVTGDAFSSISNNDLSIDSLSTPLPDQLAANLTVSPSGAKTTVSLMPLGFSPRYHAVWSELRLELFGNAATQPEFGFGVSIGYNSAAKKLTESAVDNAFVRANIAKCMGSANPNYAAEVRILAFDGRRMVAAIRGAGPPRPPLTAAALDELDRDLATPSNSPDWVKNVKRAAGQLSAGAGGSLNIEANYPQLKGNADAIAWHWQQLVNAINTNLDSVGDCLAKAFAKYRVDAAFANAIGVYLKGTFHFFPVGTGPTFKANDGSTSDPFTNALSLASIGLSGFYWHSRYFRILPSVAFSWTGASPINKQLDKKVAAGIDVGYARSMGKPDKDGFEPTYGFGVNVGFEKCLESPGCTKGDIPSYSGPKPKEDWLLSAGLYAFIRVSAKLQFQFTAPINTFSLTQPIDATSSSQTIVEFIPTLTASVAGWTVAQPNY